MKVKFWGVRGSIPVPGAATVRYGGNTSCVEVVSASGTQIAFDAGTGLRHLGKQLTSQAFGEGKGKAHILISHTHWDHIQGLPFFSPLYQKGNQISLYARKRDDLRLRTILANQTAKPFFPVPLHETRAGVEFTELPDSASFEIDDVSVKTTMLNHPYIATAYSLQADGHKVVYVSDTAPFEKILFGEEFVAKPDDSYKLSITDQRKLDLMRDALCHLCDGADLVIYDTMFTEADYEANPHFGHSRPIDAIAICAKSGVRKLALYHHSPERSDDALEDMLRDAQKLAAEIAPQLRVVAAFEGLVINLGPQR